MSNGYPDIEDLIVHRGAMRLIDKVVASTDQSVTVEARVDASSPFMIEGVGVPTYVGLELMAQAVCAYDGVQSIGDGTTPTVGFLLGCRRYIAHRRTLPLGAPLRIVAALAFVDSGMAAFDCAIEDADGSMLAEGTVTVYRTGPAAAWEKRHSS